jgi:hypothetical protein
MRRARASPENQLSQEDHLYTSRGVADEHELVGPALDVDSSDDGEGQQQEVEQEDEANNENDRQQQDVNNVAAVVTVERVGDGLPRFAKRKRPSLSYDGSMCKHYLQQMPTANINHASSPIGTFPVTLCP